MEIPESRRKRPEKEKEKMNAKQRVKVLLKEIDEEFSGKVVLEVKSTKWYWRVLGFLHYLVTFGNKDFMTRITTVMGPKIGLPQDPEDMLSTELYELLLHERAHLRQMRRLSRNMWVGAFLHMLLYAFVFFPIGLAYFRAKYEKEGYKETIRAWIHLYGPEEVTELSKSLIYKNFIVKQFTSSVYLYMWPFKKRISRWYDKTLEDVMREEGVFPVRVSDGRGD